MTASTSGEIRVADLAPPPVTEDILREQLDELIAHHHECGEGSCRRCADYSQAKAILTAVFQ